MAPCSVLTRTIKRHPLRGMLEFGILFYFLSNHDSTRRKISSLHGNMLGKGYLLLLDIDLHAWSCLLSHLMNFVKTLTSLSCRIGVLNRNISSSQVSSISKALAFSANGPEFEPQRMPKLSRRNRYETRGADPGCDGLKCWLTKIQRP